MEKYDIIGPLGEGSFGRVYKAKQLATEEFVALKVISKRGRTPKEIKNLRKECEIQRTLNHPNIIQMLDSFETNDEIVVITEFAHKALHVILGNKGFLPENRVQTIVWDLVSALYYLHSHRVLHRDLKPQNILLDARDRAKLCDFGFARNMSTGTHVLTSIKGTPLYMAPELIDELPYDHNADLWSLGCIIYELLVGAPPFCTVSILHLIRLIRYKPVEWPTSLSQNCISFLKGLLQKDPKQRFTWATILEHPFVKGHILIQENDLDMPLTRPMSSNTLQRKEEQHNGHVNNKIAGQSTKALLKAFEVEDKKSGHSKTSKNSENGHSSNQNPHCFELDLKNNNSQPNLSEKFNNLSLESDLQKNNSVDFKSSKEFTSTFKLTEECHPIETEEWIAFLQKSIEEIINGEIISISQPNLANILVSPLRNSNTCPKVVTYVAKLFSIPFVVKEISKKSLEQIKKVYLEVKLVPNLVYSSKLLLRQKSLNTDSGPSSENSPLFNNPEKQKTLDEITENDLDGLENIFLLISHLVFLEEDFLLQFCDAIAVLNIYPLLQILIKLSRRKLRIVLDLIAILTHILRKFPEHIELVEKILINDLTNENDYIDFNILLRHEDMILRERICFCLMFLSKCNSKILEGMWNENMKETLEALMFDSIEIVRNAAEKCVEEIKRHPYYYRIEITT